MSSFRFKEFEIIQAINSQKVGVDSMLLGAWTTGDYKRILDIGTGTGILALMQAQQNPVASITAIEPHLASLNEAITNFKNSKYAHNLLGIHTNLQSFGSMDKFDLIITNPPYFENAFLSEDQNRNRARHTNDLPIHEIYECVADLLAEEGTFNIIVPFDIETTHIERAFDNGLFIKRILHTKRDDGEIKRSLISFSFDEVDPILEEMIVKHSDNSYSKEYITLTKNFYSKDLNKKNT